MSSDKTLKTFKMLTLARKKSIKGRDWPAGLEFEWCSEIFLTIHTLQPTIKLRKQPDSVVNLHK